MTKAYSKWISMESRVKWLDIHQTLPFISLDCLSVLHHTIIILIVCLHSYIFVLNIGRNQFCENMILMKCHISPLDSMIWIHILFYNERNIMLSILHGLVTYAWHDRKPTSTNWITTGNHAGVTPFVNVCIENSTSE